MVSDVRRVVHSRLLRVVDVERLRDVEEVVGAHRRGRGRRFGVMHYYEDLAEFVRVAVGAE